MKPSTDVETHMQAWSSGYEVGYRAGLEAAAKVFDHYCADEMTGAQAAELIRALSPSPSATDSNKTDALPRPEK